MLPHTEHTARGAEATPSFAGGAHESAAHPRLTSLGSAASLASLASGPSAYDSERSTEPQQRRRSGSLGLPSSPLVASRSIDNTLVGGSVRDGRLFTESPGHSARRNMRRTMSDGNLAASEMFVPGGNSRRGSTGQLGSPGMLGNGHALFVPRYLRRGGSRLPMSSGPSTQTHTFGTPGLQPAMLRPPRPRRMSLSSETDSETGSTQLNAGVPTRRFSCAKKPCCASVAWVIVGCMLAAVGVSLVAYGAHRTSSASLPTVEWGVCEVVPMYAHSQDRAHVDAANAGDGAALPGLVASCTEYSGRELIPTVLSDVRAAAEHAGVATTAAMDGSNGTNYVLWRHGSDAANGESGSVGGGDGDELDASVSESVRPCAALELSPLQNVSEDVIGDTVVTAATQDVGDVAYSPFSRARPADVPIATPEAAGWQDCEHIASRFLTAWAVDAYELLPCAVLVDSGGGGADRGDTGAGGAFTCWSEQRHAYEKSMHDNEKSKRRNEGFTYIDVGSGLFVAAMMLHAVAARSRRRHRLSLERAEEASVRGSGRALAELKVVKEESAKRPPDRAALPRGSKEYVPASPPAPDTSNGGTSYEPAAVVEDRQI